MKHFVTLKSATCCHPCLPIHPSAYTYEHHYVHFLKGSGRKSQRSQRGSSLGTTRVFEQLQPWVSLAWTG